ncbi:MAG: hypothetical protein KH219_06225 [Peptoniphilus harei]|jgi:hypothetical protein|nr:hypothetical protein [Peptoniphilus harei]MDU4671033.1 ABC transporter substrate-binding protein [Finegoldia magna]
MKKLLTKKNSIIAMILVLFMLIGCSKSEEKDMNKEDKKILTIGVDSETMLLSPLYMDSMNYSTTKLVYENLVNFEDGEIKPGLAESWEYSDDGKELTFNIRKDVKLHNGEEFTAEVVKKNLEHKQSNPSFYTLKGITEIQSMEVKDKNTLTIHYPRPYYAYLSDFCWPDVMPIIAPELLIEGDFQTVKGVIGTGPYKYDEFISGKYTKFIKNEDYWGDKPYFDEIIVKYIPDTNTRIKALKAGEIDLIYGSNLISYDQYNDAINSSNIKGIIADKDTRARDITLNASGNLLNDIDVRKAIAYAINKEDISKGITGDIEKIANLPFTEDSHFFDLDLKNKFEYDKEKSNELLDKAGWKLNEKTNIREKNGVALNLKFITYPSYDAVNDSIVTLLKSQLSDVGINVNIVTLEKMEWYQTYMNGDFDISIWLGQYAYANPHSWFNPMDTMTPQTAALKNVEGADDFFEKIKMTQGLTDENELQSIFSELINFDLGNVIDIPLTYQKDLILYNSDIVDDYKFNGVPTFFDIHSLIPKK